MTRTMIKPRSAFNAKLSGATAKTRTIALAATLALAMAAPDRIQGAERYKDDVFTSTTLTSNIEYGSAKNYAGATEKLLLDLYQPQGDTATARPLFLWIHGGG